MDGITDDSIEVCWDHDSPTPAVWKRLQGPCKNEEDLQCSPKLPKFKRRFPPPSHQPIDDDHRFKESRKEVDQIINALRKASNQGELSQISVERRLVIPEMPEEEESDDDRILSTVAVPFQYTGQPNTSLDVIFNMSGGGENLPSTMRSSNTAQTVSKGDSSGGDAWMDDDDIFNDEVLMSQVEDAANKPVTSVYPSAQKTSTPSNTTTKSIACPTRNVSSAQDTRSSPRGLLNFFMDEGKPPKPSPKKDKPNGVAYSKNSNKFASKARSFKTIPRENSAGKMNATSGTALRLPVAKQTQSTRHCSNTAQTNATSAMQNNFTHVHEAAKEEKEGTKPADTGIPMDVLEELIMEDSWVETEDEMEIGPGRKESVNQDNAKRNLPSHAGISSSERCSSEIIVNPNSVLNSANNYKFRRAGNPSNNNAAKFNNANTPPKPVPCTTAVPSIKNVKSIKNFIKNHNISIDGFSSDDEDMLLKAIALTESQRSAKDSSSAAGRSIGVLTRASVPPGENQKLTSRDCSQPKCSLPEIERKKRIAMERRLQRMKRRKPF